MKFLLLISLSCFGHSFLPKEKWRKKKSVTIRKPRKVTGRVENTFEQKLKKLEKKTFYPSINMSGIKKLRYGTKIGGILKFSVLSSANPSPMEVHIDEKFGYPKGSKLYCDGITQLKRVFASCFIISTPSKDINVKGILLDTDGSMGLRGKFFDPSGEKISQGIVSDSIGAVLEGQRQTNQSVFGNSIIKSYKNAAIDGIIGGISRGKDILNESAQDNGRVLVKKNKRVIFFVNNR